MAFDVNTVTLKGAELLASATAANRLVIVGCDADTTVLTEAQAQLIVNRPATPLSNTTVVTQLGATAEHVMCRAYFQYGQSTGGDANTLYLYGYNEQSPSDIYVIYVCSSSTPFHLPEAGDVIDEYQAEFDIVYALAQGSIGFATQATYNTQAEFLLLKERTVTTHAEGTPTTGENQTIYGDKTFKGVSYFSYLVRQTSGTSNKVIINNYGVAVYDSSNNEVCSLNAPSGEIMTVGKVTATTTDVHSEFSNIDISEDLTINNTGRLKAVGPIVAQNFVLFYDNLYYNNTTTTHSVPVITSNDAYGVQDDQIADIKNIRYCTVNGDLSLGANASFTKHCTFNGDDIDLSFTANNTGTKPIYTIDVDWPYHTPLIQLTCGISADNTSDMKLVSDTVTIGGRLDFDTFRIKDQSISHTDYATLTTTTNYSGQNINGTTIKFAFDSAGSTSVVPMIAMRVYNNSASNNYIVIQAPESEIYSVTRFVALSPQIKFSDANNHDTAMTIYGDLTVTNYQSGYGNLSVARNLTVSGDTALGGDLTITGNKNITITDGTNTAKMSLLSFSISMDSSHFCTFTRTGTGSVSGTLSVGGLEGTAPVRSSGGTLNIPIGGIVLAYIPPRSSGSAINHYAGDTFDPDTEYSGSLGAKPSTAYWVSAETSGSLDNTVVGYNSTYSQALPSGSTWKCLNAFSASTNPNSTVNYGIALLMRIS